MNDEEKNEAEEPEIEEVETEEAETAETDKVDSPPEDKVKPVTPFDPANPVLPAAAPKNDVKIIMMGNGDNWMLGVQSTDCDPVYTTMQGDLAAALQRVPALIEEAKQKWATSKRYPQATNIPAEEPAPVRTTPARTPAAPKEKEKKQPSFF